LSLDFSSVDGIVCEEARGYCEIFLERFAGEIRSCSEGIVELLELAVTHGVPFDVAWSAEFGWLMRSVVRGSVDPLASAVRVALKFFDHGHPASWSCRLRSPRTFRVSNCLLQNIDQLDADVCGNTMTLSFGRNGNTTSRILKSLAGNHFDVPSNVVRIATTSFFDQNVTCINQEVFPIIDFPLNDLPWTTGPESDVVRSCDKGLSLLDRASPQFAAWVSHVIRDVVPLKADRFIRSQSTSDYPSTIALSSPSTRTSIAEMFVHETSHQYYHILQKFEPVQNPAIEENFFSPVKGVNRPLCMILLAYHAFANVVLFYRKCLDAGIEETAQCRHNIARHLPELRDMEKSLSSSRSLTDAGRLLYEPLANLIADI
jgi:hypothetical protein